MIDWLAQVCRFISFAYLVCATINVAIFMHRAIVILDTIELSKIMQIICYVISHTVVQTCLSYRFVASLSNARFLMYLSATLVSCQADVQGTPGIYWMLWALQDTAEYTSRPSRGNPASGPIDNIGRWVDIHIQELLPWCFTKAKTSTSS